ncbi:MAG: hypothetical protein V5788_02180, partial [Shewanella sp.]
LEGGGRSSRYIWATLHDMDEWHRKYSRLVALVEEKQETQHMAHGALYGYWWLRLGPQLTLSVGTDGDGETQVEKVTKNLGDLMMTGHFKKAAQLTQLIQPELLASFINGGWPYYPHAWFLLDLCCRWQGLAFEVSDFKLPKKMYIYPEVLAEWDTKDVSRVQELVTKMADYHIAQSKSNMRASDTYDFSRAMQWLFPYEILTWLKLRQYLGLPNPETFEHPLMHLPQAQMPENTPLPEDPLLTALVKKLITETNINIDPYIDLVE